MGSDDLLHDAPAVGALSRERKLAAILMSFWLSHD
jgi:hypothetical protein